MSKQKLNICVFEHFPILEQLRIEEALLRADQGNWCIINKGSPAAIVMGISGSIEDHLNKKQHEKHPVPIIRRFSGGGTVVVDSNTFFVSFIIRNDTLPIERSPQSVLQWTKTFYQPIFAPIAFDVRENDYVIGQRKIGGNAQYFTKDRYVHHSTFLWDYCKEHMQLLKMPPKTPQYRLGRPHSDFVDTIKSHMESQDFLQKRLLERLSELFELTSCSLKTVQAITHLPHRKATTLINT